MAGGTLGALAGPALGNAAPTVSATTALPAEYRVEGVRLKPERTAMSIDDFLWGTQKIFGFTFEMYPRSSNPGFYPPDEVIPEETARNKEAVLKLIEYADCPYRAIGQSC